MSRHICFRCACGKADFGASSWFTTVVWDDLTGVLEEIGPENPYRHLPDDAEVDGGDFHRWWEEKLARMRAVRDRLPTIHEIWLERGESAMTDAAYFSWRGVVYMADSVYDRISATPMPPEVWEERAPSVPYDPPVLEDVAPELASMLSPDPEPRRPGAYLLRADEFERIFRGTPLELEHGDVLDFFAGELAEASAVARHAAERGERVILYTY